VHKREFGRTALIGNDGAMKAISGDSAATTGRHSVRIRVLRSALHVPTSGIPPVKRRAVAIYGISPVCFMKK
jgi:hypothetical protein